MYAARMARNEEILMNRTRIKGTKPFEPEGRVAKLQPVPKWSGMWKPRVMRETLTMGTLSEDLAPLVAHDPEAFNIQALVAPTVQGTTPFMLPPQSATQTESPSIWSSLMGGLSSIVNARVGGEVARQTQQAAARAWNPAITGPALQAQAWQQAYSSGTGAAPLGLSTGALVAGGLVLLGIVYMAAKK